MSKKGHADDTEVQKKNQSEVSEQLDKFQREEGFPLSLQYYS